MKKNLLTYALTFCGLFLSLSFAACFETDDWWDDSYSGGGYDSEDSTEDLLLVTESSEDAVVLEYNTETFSALFNWEDGNYYFSPDPDGTKSGDKIVCAAAISAYEVEGDCFRSGLVCHFLFYEDYYSDIEGKDAYYIYDSSCSEGPGVGPFLVPLTSSPCGEDPYPACPSDDLFPEGYDDEEDGDEEEGEEEEEEVEDGDEENGDEEGEDEEDEDEENVDEEDDGSMINHGGGKNVTEIDAI